MHVKHVYNWGYFHPVTCGADVVASNQLDYFRERGWTVDCIVINDPRKTCFADSFRAKYHWVRKITTVDLPPAGFSLREQLFAYEHACKSEVLAQALVEPADLLFTNYVFTSPLLAHIPRSCTRVLETVDVLAPQFAAAENQGTLPSEGCRNPLDRARLAYLLSRELDLYALFDAVIMITERELETVRTLGISNAYYVPQAYPLARKEPGPWTNQEYDLLFVGSNAPINAQGIRWFYRHVYVPYLWRRQVRLAIGGGVCQHLNFHDMNVTLLPKPQESLASLYASARVVIAPVFDGTGLSIKTLEGLAMGSAMVVTPVGARGFDDTAAAYVKVDMKQSPQRTAELILELLASPERRKKLQQAALGYVRRCFSREVYFAAMDRVLAFTGLGVQQAPALRVA